MNAVGLPSYCQELVQGNRIWRLKRKEHLSLEGCRGLRAASLSLEGNRRLFLPGRNDWVKKGTLRPMPVYMLACIFQLLLGEREKKGSDRECQCCKHLGPHFLSINIQ